MGQEVGFVGKEHNMVYLKVKVRHNSGHHLDTPDARACNAAISMANGNSWALNYERGSHHRVS